MIVTVEFSNDVEILRMDVGDGAGGQRDFEIMNVADTDG